MKQDSAASCRPLSDRLDQVAWLTCDPLTQEGATDWRLRSLVFKPALSFPVEEGSLMSSWCYHLLLKFVPCPKSTLLFEDCSGMPKLLLRFTTWPFVNLYYQFGTCFRTFWSSGVTPGSDDSESLTDGILLYVVTSPLLRSVTGYHRCYFASQRGL